MQTKKSVFNLQINHIQDAIKMKNKFPLIANSSTTKALMSLSRRESFDYASLQVSKELKPKLNIQPIKSLKHINSTQDSPIKRSESYKSLSKLSKAIYFAQKLQSNRTNLFSSLSKLQQQLQPKKQYEPEPPPLLIPPKQLPMKEDVPLYNELNKFSDKKIGFICGYAANSHVGIFSTHQNNRICIKNNMVRLGNKLKQISFYAVFEGRNGYAKAEFMKQNFYNVLVSDELFLYNFQKAISRAFQTIDKQFNYDPRFEGDYSVSYCVMCIVIVQKMYIIRYGSPNATISMNLGSYIKSMYVQYKNKQIALSKKKSFSSFTAYNNSTKISPAKEEIHIRMFQINNNFDFLVLGSEGLYQVSNFYNELGQTVWKYMLDEEIFNTNNNNTAFNIKQMNNTSKLAKVCSKICEESAKMDPFGRCISMILIQFPNMQACFEDPEQMQLQLPIGKGMKMNRFSPLKEQQSLMLQRQLTLKIVSNQQQTIDHKVEVNLNQVKNVNIE